MGETKGKGEHDCGQTSKRLEQWLTGEIGARKFDAMVRECGSCAKCRALLEGTDTAEEDEE